MYYSKKEVVKKMGDLGNVKTEILENIAKYRQLRGVTQKEISEATGKNRSTVSGWEIKNSAPDIELLPKICKALNISISDLFGKYANERTKDGLSKELQELLKKAEDLNEEGQKQAKDFFDYLDYKFNKKIE